MEEVVDGAVELAVAAGLDAVEELEGFGVVDEGGDGEGDAAGLADLVPFLLEEGPLADHFEVDGNVLGEPKAAHAPAGEGHFVDEGGFDGVGRLKFRDEGIAEGIEQGAVLVGEEVSAAGVGAVLVGVLRGAGLTLRGYGATGLGSVDARGFGALVGGDAFRHKSSDVSVAGAWYVPVMRVTWVHKESDSNEWGM